LINFYAFIPVKCGFCIVEWAKANWRKLPRWCRAGCRLSMLPSLWLRMKSSCKYTISAAKRLRLFPLQRSLRFLGRYRT